MRVGARTTLAKPRTVYVCDSCGAESPKWEGRCPLLRAVEHAGRAQAGRAGPGPLDRRVCSCRRVVRGPDGRHAPDCGRLAGAQPCAGGWHRARLRHSRCGRPRHRQIDAAAATGLGRGGSAGPVPLRDRGGVRIADQDEGRPAGPRRQGSLYPAGHRPRRDQGRARKAETSSRRRRLHTDAIGRRYILESREHHADQGVHPGVAGVGQGRGCAGSHHRARHERRRHSRSARAGAHGGRRAVHGGRPDQLVATAEVCKEPLRVHQRAGRVRNAKRGPGRRARPPPTSSSESAGGTRWVRWSLQR